MIDMLSPKRKAASVMRSIRSRFGNRHMRILQKGSSRINLKDLISWWKAGKVKYQKLPSGNSDYIEFYDKNGEMVATYSNNGWTMYTTNAEASRQTEMCMIYNEAWGMQRGAFRWRVKKRWVWTIRRIALMQRHSRQWILWFHIPNKPQSDKSKQASLALWQIGESGSDK